MPDLDPEAVRALTDFEFFRRAYFGHKSLEWHLQFARYLEAWTDEDEKTYGLANEPPGVGKTTTALAYLCWRIVRNRRIRCLYGSNTGVRAEEGIALVRTWLDASEPVMPDEEDVAAGFATEPWRVLAHDFGTFRPLSREVGWKATAFNVEQYDGRPKPHKEPTLAAYGGDSKAQLGGRYDVAIWDDLVTPESMGTPEAAEKLRRRWDSVSESRLQPRGVMVLMGQRIASGDLYAYVRAKSSVQEDGSEPAKYHHVVFPAHDEKICQSNHAKATARPWPMGCLLDPYRLPWFGNGGLATIMAANPEVYEVWYQQRDGSPDGALIRDVWLEGGVDHYADGVVVPGCWDKERVAGDKPKGLSVRNACRVAAVDPSAAKHWAVIDVALPYDADTRVLVDSFDGPMSADELLDYDITTREFKGIMHRWQLRSIDQGLPIRTWIVEANAAQRHLLQHDYVREWAKKYQVQIWPHQTTGKNKLDPDLGPTSLREPHRAGMWRYPRGDITSIRKTETMRQQLITWPSPVSRSDQVMALWFIEYHRPRFARQTKPLPLLPRASWQRRRSA